MTQNQSSNSGLGESNEFLQLQTFLFNNIFGKITQLVDDEIQSIEKIPTGSVPKELISSLKDNFDLNLQDFSKKLFMEINKRMSLDSDHKINPESDENIEQTQNNGISLKDQKHSNHEEKSNNQNCQKQNETFALVEDVAEDEQIISTSFQPTYDDLNDKSGQINSNPSNNDPRPKSKKKKKSILNNLYSQYDQWYDNKKMDEEMAILGKRVHQTIIEQSMSQLGQRVTRSSKRGGNQMNGKITNIQTFQNQFKDKPQTSKGANILNNCNQKAKDKENKTAKSSSKNIESSAKENSGNMGRSARQAKRQKIREEEIDEEKRRLKAVEANSSGTVMSQNRIDQEVIKIEMVHQQSTLSPKMTPNHTDNQIQKQPTEMKKNEKLNGNPPLEQNTLKQNSGPITESPYENNFQTIESFQTHAFEKIQLNMDVMEKPEDKLDQLKKENLPNNAKNKHLAQTGENEPNQNQENQSPNVAPIEMIEEDADMEKEVIDSNQWPQSQSIDIENLLNTQDQILIEGPIPSTQKLQQISHKLENLPTSVQTNEMFYQQIYSILISILQQQQYWQNLDTVGPENSINLKIIDFDFLKSLNGHLLKLKSIRESMSVHDQVIWAQRKNITEQNSQNIKVQQYLKAEKLKDQYVQRILWGSDGHFTKQPCCFLMPQTSQEPIANVEIAIINIKNVENEEDMLQLDTYLYGIENSNKLYSNVRKYFKALYRIRDENAQFVQNFKLADFCPISSKNSIQQQIIQCLCQIQNFIFNKQKLSSILQKDKNQQFLQFQENSTSQIPDIFEKLCVLKETCDITSTSIFGQAFDADQLQKLESQLKSFRIANSIKPPTPAETIVTSQEIQNGNNQQVQSKLIF